MCLGGVFTALVVLFHSAPVFMPGIGLLLSPFATLPVALATVISTYLGIAVLFSSALILLVISPQEAVILLLATGALGVALGACYGKDIVKSTVFTSGTLFLGINLLTNIMGISAFGDISSNLALLTATVVYLIFSIVYSIIWIFILKCTVRLLKGTQQFDTQKIKSKAGDQYEIKKAK
jgi:hypothetical protein